MPEDRRHGPASRERLAGPLGEPETRRPLLRGQVREQLARLGGLQRQEAEAPAPVCPGREPGGEAAEAAAAVVEEDGPLERHY